MTGIFATYKRVERDALGFRRYLVTYARADGVFGGFECVTAQHGQRGIDAVYAAAELRAAAHGLRLERVALED